MSSTLVVPVDIIVDALVEFYCILTRVQVHMFVLKAAPEAFDEGIVRGAALAVHTQLDALAEDVLTKHLTGKLGSLIRVENIGLAILLHRLFDYLHAPFSLHRVRQGPIQYHPAMQIDHCRQIHKAFRHWNISDIGGPDLISVRDR